MTDENTDESDGSTEQKHHYIPSRSRTGRGNTRLAEIQRARRDEVDETWGGGKSPFAPNGTAPSPEAKAEGGEEPGVEATEDAVEPTGGVEIPEDGTAKAALARTLSKQNTIIERQVERLGAQEERIDELERHVEDLAGVVERMIEAQGQSQQADLRSAGRDGEKVWGADSPFAPTPNR